MSTACPACGEPMRKGHRRYLQMPSGELVMRVVCKACVKRALQVVSVSRTAPPCDVCRDKGASVCTGCSALMVAKAHALKLAPYVEQIRKLAKAYRLNDDPKHEGLEMAADVLEATVRT